MTDGTRQSDRLTSHMEQPLNDIINNRDATGRIAKWAIELLPFDIIYKPDRVRESWIRGCPDGRTMPFGRTPGL